MSSWRNLGFVETIYEEECECKSSSSSPSLTPSPSSPPITSLQSRVDAWSQTKRCKTNVILRVQGKCFHLHKEHDEKITEEQKMQICNFIDCNKLSSKPLLHAVQNPRMPLRFIIRAMLAEQLNTRRCILSTDNYDHHRQQLPPLQRHHSDDPITLGAILERDAARREAAQLKEAMTATNLRIKNLEQELNGMKLKLLNHNDQKERIIISEVNEMKERSVLDAGRSASFHYGKENSKIERGERGSISNLNIRSSGGDRFANLPKGYQSNPKMNKKNKNIGQRLIFGLKTAFGVSKQSSNSGKLRDGDKENENLDEFVVIGDDDLTSHRRSIDLLH